MGRKSWESQHPPGAVPARDVDGATTPAASSTALPAAGAAAPTIPAVASIAAPVLPGLGGMPQAGGVAGVANIPGLGALPGIALGGTVPAAGSPAMAQLLGLAAVGGTAPAPGSSAIPPISGLGGLGATSPALAQLQGLLALGGTSPAAGSAAVSPIPGLVGLGATSPASGNLATVQLQQLAALAGTSPASASTAAPSTLPGAPAMPTAVGGIPSPGAAQSLGPNLHALLGLGAVPGLGGIGGLGAPPGGIPGLGAALAAPAGLPGLNGLALPGLGVALNGFPGIGVVPNLGALAALSALQRVANPAVANPALANPANVAPPAVKETPRIHGDILDLTEHYEIEERIALKLNEAMKDRQDTWATDMQKLWDDLETAKSPAGLLMAKIQQMNEGTFVGKVKPSKDMAEVIKKYKLDYDASTKLTEFLFSRKDKAKDDLREIERRLSTSGKPSAMVMMCLMKLRNGEPLPEPYPAKKGSRGGDRGDRDRDRRRSRSRDRRRSRSRSRSRSRDRR